MGSDTRKLRQKGCVLCLGATCTCAGEYGNCDRSVVEESNSETRIPTPRVTPWRCRKLRQGPNVGQNYRKCTRKRTPYFLINASTESDNRLRNMTQNDVRRTRAGSWSPLPAQVSGRRRSAASGVRPGCIREGGRQGSV